jgi:hypothetical protein
MGEIIEFFAYIFVGIFWLVTKGFEKATGRDLGLLGALLAIVLSAVLCTGVVALLIHILF